MNAPQSQPAHPSIRAFAQEYKNRIRQCLDEIDLGEAERAIALLQQAYDQEKQIFIMGNGGSASTASHFATDLGKGAAVGGRRRFRAISLTDNVALISAIGNDLGFEQIFVEQLRTLLCPEDVVILISGSGSSPNLLHAAEFAKSRDARSLGILGSGGGQLLPLLDASITLKSRHYGHVEAVHLVVEHLICNYFMRSMGVSGY